MAALKFVVMASLLFLVLANSQARAQSVGQVEMKSLPETIGLEHQDRINRMARFSKEKGVQPPKVSEVQLEAGRIPGTDYPVPVVRVLFDEGVFFDTNEDMLKPSGRKVIEVLARSIGSDVPDVKLLVMGHTDSVGTVEYNIELSKRRAVNIMKMLVGLGISSDSMLAIPIGMSQPIAPNSTEEGRSKNRRVEFMLSASEKANLELVTLKRVISDYLPAELAAQNFALNNPTMASVIGVSVDGNGVATVNRTEEIELQKPSSLDDIVLNKTADYQLKELNNEFVLE